MNPPASPPLLTSRRFAALQLLVWLGVGGWLGWLEWERWQQVRDWNVWLTLPHYDTTLPAVIWLLAPLCRWGGSLSRRPREGTESRWFGPATQPTGPADHFGGWRAWLAGLTVAALSVLASWSVAEIVVQPRPELKLGQLPPAYHDEYSYLFQAETFRAGRLSFPGHPTQPELFGQMHVLNEGRFVSRYFPVTGAWIAPFLALGHPIWGHWLAGALTTWFVFWTGRELGGNGVGFLAGLLTAASPGLALFSNLLLAHHPTLAALTGFLCCFLRMIRTQRLRYSVAAGLLLAVAMLARPMTAAGFALPWGMYFVAWLIGGRRENRLTHFLGMGLPLLAGFGVLGTYNQALTGSALTSPYQLYTDTYTPRHVYGFNNVIRGEQRLGPKVLKQYDEWAENLTPALAWENVQKRWLASWQWTLGLVALLVCSLIYLLTLPRWPLHWHLTVAGMLSLHLAHVPYWFTGIMHWHYVFETAPLWLLLAAGVSVWLFHQWRAEQRPLLIAWWLAFLAVTAAGNWLGEPVWPASRVQLAAGEIAFSRLQYYRLNQQIARLVQQTPALVLIVPDDAQFHIDPINNHPSLQGDILRARWNPATGSLSEIRRDFPDRTLYLIDMNRQTAEKLPEP